MCFWVWTAGHGYNRQPNLRVVGTVFGNEDKLKIEELAYIQQEQYKPEAVQPDSGL